MIMLDQPGVVVFWRCLSWLWIGLLTDAIGSGLAAGTPADSSRLHKIATLAAILLPVLFTHAALIGFAGVFSRTYPWAAPATLHLLFSGAMTLVLLPWLAGSVLPRWQARYEPWLGEIRDPGRPTLPPGAIGWSTAGIGVVAWVIGALISRWGYGVTALSHHEVGSRTGWGLWVPVALALLAQAACYARWRTNYGRAALGSSEYGRYGMTPLSR